MRAALLALAALLASGAQPASAADTALKSTTLRALLPTAKAESFAQVLPVDEIVRFRVFVPPGAGAPGVLVFASPTPSGEPQPGWLELLERRNLAWIAAEDFGNAKPSAQRTLAVLMGLALARQMRTIDSKRVYVGGMSGGGRIASKAVTMFPQLFSGAIYIVGADFWTRAERPSLPQIITKRYAFITGSGDFNRGEMLDVARKYRKAGAKNLLVLDLKGFKHQYPDPETLSGVIDFLDGDPEKFSR
jgi:pimeloyl-ACP methyl ester carboxylesterase